MSNDPTTKTALNLITGAMRKTGQYAAGEPISAADANDALDVLNALLDSMSNDGLAVFNSEETSFNLVPGQQSYTVGPSGYVTMDRPLNIKYAYTRLTSGSNAIDFPCDIKTEADYVSLSLKSQPGPWPKWLFYNSGWPLSTMYVWPVPTQALEMYFWSDTLLQTVSLNASSLRLPQGYYNYLQFALAELLCVDYGLPVPPDLRRLAAKFEAKIKSTNSKPTKTLAVDAAIGAGNANNAGWFLTGGF